MEDIKALINKFLEMQSYYSNMTSYNEAHMSANDVALLCAIEASHLDELETIIDTNETCLGTIILVTHGSQEFFRVMDAVAAAVSREVFKWMIDYDAKLVNGGNPLDIGVFELSEYFDAVDKYYDGRYNLIYSICSYNEYETFAHYIIGTDREHGKQRIVSELEGRAYDASTFDKAVLDGIWAEYYE